MSTGIYYRPLKAGTCFASGSTLWSHLMNNVGNRATDSDIAYLTGLSVAYPDVKELIDAINKYGEVELYCKY